MLKKVTKIASGDSSDHHTIQVVARYTGLSTDLIRTWEKRYDVVTPARSSKGKRLYSDANIQRLTLLRQLTRFGRRISQVAHLPTGELIDLAKSDENAVMRRPDHGKTRPSTSSVMDLFDKCFSAVLEFNTGYLQNTLRDASEGLGVVFLIEDLISPLLNHVEGECLQGELLNCQQRLFIEVIRGYLMGICVQNEATIGESFVICSMDKDPMLTALRAAVIVNASGWNPIYLGECATADEIAGTTEASGAKAVIISFGDLSEDSMIPNEMRRLAQRLPKKTSVVIHAPEASAYSSVLNETEAQQTHSFGELRLQFERLTANDPE